jgi:metallo-beta-lactamase family protein
MIKITFTGAARDVTGSRHLLELNTHKMLLDCGLYQGRRQETYARNLNFPFNPAELEALFLSHAHIDHIGNVPNLVRQGFQGDIHCTAATADLANVMLMDAAHIQESDAAFVNKINKKKNQGSVTPLYTRADIPPVLKLLASHGYDRYFRPLEDVRAVFRDAGHVLGSAITVLDIHDDGRHVGLCYTGDLGREGLPLIRDPFVVKDADVLIIESTYGNRVHGQYGQIHDKIAKVINQTVARKGKMIIPSFALERTQEVVYTLHQLRLENKIGDFPIFVDSPLATDATDIFRLHPECFDDATNEFIRTVDDPFGFRHLTYTRTTEESKMINNMPGPLMVIAGSGMAENGRVLHHLKNNIEDPKNTVMIVGWQSENTLGRKIADKLPQVPIFGELYNLKAQVEVFDEFSAHADHDDLVNWVKQGKWQKIFVVHGEESSSLAIAKDYQDMGFKDVIVPELGQSYII